MAINDPDTPVMTDDVPEGAVVREGEYGTAGRGRRARGCRVHPAARAAR